MRLLLCWNRKESDEESCNAVKWRNLIAFWLLGLCTNYAYYIMLSAAHDILDQSIMYDTIETNATVNETRKQMNETENDKDCNGVSTGMILMASVLPSLLVKLISPFITSYVTLQMAIAILMNIASFIMVSFSQMTWMTYTGVVLASISGGLGEVTLLKLQTSYDKNALSAFSSGSGFSGFIGSFSYAGITAGGLTPRTTLLLMITFPAIMAVTYFIVLVPTAQNNTEQVQQNANENEDRQTISQRIKLLKNLFPKYILPLATVYFCQYFINQGLFELMYFKRIWLSHEEQYRWYQVVYQIGVFISKSSVNVILFHRLWILAFLQMANVVVLATETYNPYLSTIWIVFGMILWEGLIGGSTYVSAYSQVSDKAEAAQRHFAIGVTSFWETLGVVVASFIAIPIHRHLCQLTTVN